MARPRVIDTAAVAATPHGTDSDVADPGSAGDVPSSDGRPAPPVVHRLSVAFGAVLVLVSLGASWSGVAALDATGAGLVTVALALTAVVLLCTLATGRERTARRLDLGVLAAAVAAAAASRAPSLFVRTPVYPSDEGRLGQLAIATLLHGGDPYARSYPSVAHFAGSTPLLGGGGFDRFGYPPLSVELGALLGLGWRPLGQPGVVGSLTLLMTAIVLFVALPAAVRAAGVAVVLTAGPFVTYAVNGHPVVLAVLLLCVAATGWTRVGAAGRLGAGGVVRALALGTACAAQQLVWPAAVAMVVAWWVVRRADVPVRRGLLARYLAVAAAGFVAAAVPFVVRDPLAFGRGLASELTQQAVPGGQGLVAFTVAVRGQSGALSWWTWAALALFAALLVLLVSDVRLLPAAPLLAPLLWLLSPRSQVEYVLAFVPLLLVWAAASADPLSARPYFSVRSTGRRPVLVAALLAPAVACVAVALVVPGPLAMRVTGERRSARGLVAITVVVHNRTARAVRPSFYVDDPTHINAPWPASARVVVPAGGTRTVALRAGVLGPVVWTPRLRVWALSDGPAAISSTAVPSPALRLTRVR